LRVEVVSESYKTSKAQVIRCTRVALPPDPQWVHRRHQCLARPQWLRRPATACCSAWTSVRPPPYARRRAEHA